MSDVVIDGATAKRVAVAALVDVAENDGSGMSRIHAAHSLLAFADDERRDNPMHVMTGPLSVLVSDPVGEDDELRASGLGVARAGSAES